MKTSWKTSAAGFVAIAVAVLGALQTMLDNNPATNPDWTSLIAAVSAGIGLMTARDNNVTSEDVGAK